MSVSPTPRRGDAATRRETATSSASGSVIPDRGKNVTVQVRGRAVKLTNLDKPFWPELGITKRGLLRYYEGMADVLVPHLAGRAMTMKRYPNGWRGEFFFMKRTPPYAPDWLTTCAIEHKSGSVIDFPVVDHAASLLWVVNTGCIDLNPWYSRCDRVGYPDFLHFDLDPVEGVEFPRVREAALVVREELERLGMTPFAKTTGATGIHVYVAIRRGPVQKDVWRFAKAFAKRLAKEHPELLTAEYFIKQRPAGRVFVDYNQNAWGQTLASVYSVRPQPRATVSTPVTWEELEAGVEVEDFRIDNVPARVEKLGDLWRPLLWEKKGRFDLEELL